MFSQIGGGKVLLHHIGGVMVLLQHGVPDKWCIKVLLHHIGGVMVLLHHISGVKVMFII